MKGDVVVVLFPFSDLSTAKRRPALVLASLRGDDVLLCQVTSQHTRDEYSAPLEPGDFSEGSLRKPNRLFTAERAIVYRVGKVTSAKTEAVVRRIVEILTSS